MIYPLCFPELQITAPLFAPLLEHNLVLRSILAGHTPAVIYTDDPYRPSTAFTWFKYRAFLAGHPQSPTFSEELGSLLNSQLIPTAQRAGIDACILDFGELGWANRLSQIFSGWQPIQAQRQFFACHTLPSIPAPGLPPGFTLLPVNAALLARDDLQHMAALRDETCSERLSVEDFLSHSFGYCITFQDELGCWCLSEYNTSGRCDVGIATIEPYQRRGLAAFITRALLEHAFRLGYTQVGWHCWARNIPSSALARKAGFILEIEHTVHIYTFREH